MLNYMKRGKGFYRDLFRLALPLILQNIIMTSLTMADTFMVGALGEAEMAGVTVAKIPLFIIDLLIFGLQSGSAVLISQYWGKGDKRAINRIIGIGYYAAGIITTLFALVMVFFPLQAMSLFSNNENLVAIAAEYIRYVGVSYIFVGLTGIYTAAHRGMENPKLGLIFFSVSAAINTVLNWILIFGKLGAPALGVEGAAIATLVSYAVGFIIMVVHASVNKGFRLIPRYIFNPGTQMLQRYIKYASPVILNETLWGAGAALFRTVMGHMQNSQEYLAAFTIAGNVVDICMIAVFAVAATSAIIVGREIGRGNAKEVYEVGAALSIISILVGLVMGGVLLILLHTVVIPVLYPIFKLSALGANTATMMLTVAAVFLSLYAYNGTNIIGVLRGGGDVKAATLIDVLPLWLIALPLSAVFGLALEMSILWVYLARQLDSVIKVFFGIKRFRSKKWINDVTSVEM